MNTTPNRLDNGPNGAAIRFDDPDLDPAPPARAAAPVKPAPACDDAAIRQTARARVELERRAGRILGNRDGLESLTDRQLLERAMRHLHPAWIRASAVTPICAAAWM